VAVTEWLRGDRALATEMTQRLGYATSSDGIRWDVHPEPIFGSARRPCVHKEGPGRYRMWMNSRPSREEPFSALYQHIYEFRSEDGIQWSRGEEPVLSTSEKHDPGGCVYPFVCHDENKYFMWYGTYPTQERAIFQIYLAESEDGTEWINHDSDPAFPISEDHDRFDSFYVSTPCVVIEPDRYLLYHSTVDWSKGEKGSYYQHIGVAVCPRG
jgi:predicted GH43/DUF377 family glycosyl hydrolase